MNTERIRCSWAGDDAMMRAYHDEEWGVPIFEDNKLFELLILEGAQAGLSWKTILIKRAAYRQAFSNFDPGMVSNYTDSRISELLSNPGIIRNRRKITAAIQNARHFLEVQAEYGSFSHYAWSFVGGKPRQNGWKNLGEIPNQTRESQAMSADLYRRGFRFTGPTICYAFMQAAGLVNDHVVDCFRYSEILKSTDQA